MKNIVITGVSTGIGYSTTKKLIENQYRVFGSVRKQEDANKLKEQFGKNFYPLIINLLKHLLEIHICIQKLQQLLYMLRFLYKH